MREPGDRSCCCDSGQLSDPLKTSTSIAVLCEAKLAEWLLAENNAQDTC